MSRRFTCMTGIPTVTTRPTDHLCTYRLYFQISISHSGYFQRHGF